MLNSSIVDEYDATRNISEQRFHSACYAPYSSLYFDTRGNVRVCCHNHQHTVGNVGRNSLNEIWNGEAIKELRSAVRQYDLSHGCSFCEWQLASRNYDNVKMRKWDKFRPESHLPTWPQMMEFSISNICNFACVMCDGNHSSVIRAHREGLGPLVSPYRDAFFTQLQEYLPHLLVARFLGGEPFLQDDCYRIWSMMMAAHLKIPCHVTTNGSISSSRMDEVLDAIPFSISISIDAWTKGTYEAIRINGNHTKLMRNVDKLWNYTRTRRTTFGLTFCLMVSNWHEFGDICLFGEQLGAHIGVNLVRRPSALSLYVLPKEQLHQVIRALEKQGERILPKLAKNKKVWLGEINRLKAHLSGNVTLPQIVRVSEVLPAVGQAK